MIIEVLTFIFLWFTMCGLWHETMHALECERQKCKTGYMWIEFTPLPSMRYNCIGGNHNEMVKLAGGLYTSILCFILVFLFKDPFVSYTFLTLGFVQLLYGLFEWKYIGKISTRLYKIGRYSIYGIIVTVMVIIYIVNGG